jgi:hypothetical protein
MLMACCRAPSLWLISAWRLPGRQRQRSADENNQNGERTFAVILCGHAIAFALDYARALFSFGAALCMHRLCKARVHDDVLKNYTLRQNVEEAPR